MKKIFVLLAVSAMFFTSCKKYDASEPLDLGTLPKVTLTGIVYAQLDETTPTLEFAPAGTTVSVSIPYSNFNLDATATGNYIQSSVIGADGKYSIQIPVVTEGVTATISFSEFTHNVKKVNSVGVVENVLTHFNLADKSVAKLGAGKGEGARISIDATYASTTTNPNDASIITPTHKIKVSGKLEYPANDTAVFVLKEVPTGTVVAATITLTAPGIGTTTRKYEEVISYTVGTEGRYEIEVPMVANGSATIKLNGESFWTYTNTTDDNKRELWRYELNTSVSGIYNVPSKEIKDKNIKYAAKTKINDLD